MFLHAIVRKFVAAILLGAFSVEGSCKWPIDGNGKVQIPDYVTAIPRYAFFKCTAAKTVFIWTQITEIGANAFTKSGLREIIFEEPDDDDYVEDGTELIFRGAVFHSCKSLHHISIPARVRHLNSAEFSHSGLQTITFASSASGALLRDISANLFYAAPITSITIPDYITVISDLAFYESGLTSINFEAGSNLKSIRKKAFYGTQLVTANIPNGVSIANDAFQNTPCENLFQAGNTVVNCHSGDTRKNFVRVHKDTYWSTGNNYWNDIDISFETVSTLNPLIGIYSPNTITNPAPEPLRKILFKEGTKEGTGHIPLFPVLKGGKYEAYLLKKGHEGQLYVVAGPDVFMIIDEDRDDDADDDW